LDTLSGSCAKAAKDAAYVSAAMYAAQPRNYFADREAFQANLQQDTGDKKRLLDALGHSVRE
jgi:hypothetical protein